MAGGPNPIHGARHARTDRRGERGAGADRRFGAREPGACARRTAAAGAGNRGRLATRLGAVLAEEIPVICSAGRSAACSRTRSRSNCRNRGSDLVYFTASLDDPTGATGASSWSDAIDGTVHNHAVQSSHWHMTSGSALARIGHVLTTVWANADNH
ncbi:hypothetical protein ACLMAJ_03380 [Nocardia sp. KC 131]|uniref:hypothetical protein n=1 Tax=Nocardia arseniciresistens TaxID=3392119 RepID=UPI00398E8BAB